MNNCTNRILARLPPGELTMILDRARRMPLIGRQSLYRPQDLITDIYFPETGVISMVVDIINGETVASEIGLIGSEGGVGLTGLLYDDPTISYHAIAQVEGEALVVRLDAALRERLPDCPVFLRRSYRFLDTLMKQTGQIAGCNLRHTVTERLGRWLLMTRDRLVGETMPMTQEFLAIMLGVRRPGVSLAVNTLQTAGLIEHRRGSITVIDSEGLEAVSCSCYRTIKTMYDQLDNSS